MPNVVSSPNRIRSYSAPPSILMPVELGMSRAEVTAPALLAALAVAIAGTTVSGTSMPIVRLQDVGQVAPYGAHALAVAEMLRVIRRRTGLTWDQLSGFFGVSRRSLHHWINGQHVAPANETKVRTLYDRTVARDEPTYVLRSKLLAEYGLAAAAEPVGSRQLPMMVADQTPIAAKVTVSRSPRTRVK